MFDFGWFVGWFVDCISEVCSMLYNQAGLRVNIG